MQSRKEWVRGTGLAAALLALLITYGLFVLYPWPHTTLNEFLAMFGRNNAAVWRAQIIWYAVALVLVGLALRAGRRSSQLACLLTAAIFEWIGIAYFAWLNPGMNLSWAWAAVFSLQAVLLLVAGVARSDLVIRPRRDLPSLLGAAFIGYALIVYPVIALLGRHPLRTVPAFGVPLGRLVMNQAKRLLVLVVSALLGTAAIVATGTAAWAAPCVTSDPHGTCGPYLYPPITESNGSNTYVLNNMWAAKPGTTQTLTANDPGNWNVVANAQPPGSTAVQTYPDGQVTLTTANSPKPLSNFGSIISSFSENMHATGSTSAQAAYDIWLGQGASTNYADEVMIWNDQANRGTCGGATVLTNVNFGGSNGVPVQNWTLCRYGPPGPTSELIWYLTNGNEQSGTVDVLSMVNWLVSNGYLPQGTGLNQIDYGFEICSTPGPETFQVSSFSITSTKPGGGQLPQVSTAAATNVTSSGVTLNGTVNPESQSTTYQFQYGATTSYGSVIPASPASAGSGTSAVNESANLTGLSANTTYHYRITATNAAGTSNGSDQQFTTSARAQAPVVVTQAATSAGQTTATLNGTVNPESQSTTYQFQYGATTSYGSVIPASPASAGSGTSAVNESANLTGLSANTTYHYRITATNAAGTSNGSDQQFTTSARAQAPVVVTQAATSAGQTTATLNGTVNPESQSTTYHFEYGTTTSYGTLIPVPDGSAGSGSTAVAENANVTGLTTSTLYHFRLDATNATGTTHGSDQTFTTTSGGGTAVAYGATGPGSSGAKVSNATSLSWNQAVSGSNTALLVGVAVGQNGDGALSASVTYNGVAMTLLKTVHGNNQPDGFLDVFGLANPASGTHSVAVSVSGGRPAEITGGSESFTGVSQSAPFSIPASAYGASGTASVAIASHRNDMAAGFMAAGSGITSATSPSASQFIANDDSFTGAGNSAGATSPSTGSNVTMAWSLTSDYWADVAVEVQHA